MGMYEYIWACMGIYGYVWIYMDIYGYVTVVYLNNTVLYCTVM